MVEINLAMPNFKTIVQHNSETHTDKIAYEQDSFREDYAPEQSFKVQSNTTKKKLKRSLMDAVIQNIKLSDEMLASVSDNDNSNSNSEDEKKAEEDEFPDYRPVLYNHAIDLLQEVVNPAEPDSSANCVPCLPKPKKNLMTTPEITDETLEQ